MTNEWEAERLDLDAYLTRIGHHAAGGSCEQQFELVGGSRPWVCGCPTL